MSPSSILLGLACDVGLLLWGTHMATSGVLRAYGTDVRRSLGRSLDGRMNGFLAGLIVTTVLQSSTATSLMATSFASGGGVGGCFAAHACNVSASVNAPVMTIRLIALPPILLPA